MGSDGNLHSLFCFSIHGFLRSRELSKKLKDIRACRPNSADPGNNDYEFKKLQGASSILQLFLYPAHQ